MAENNIYTIGHSTRSAEEFIYILKAFHIQLLVDVRLYPGSKRHPQFNKEALEKLLGRNNIGYLHLKDLGGKRKPRKDSVNTAWQEEGFRGYADYMQTAPFKKAVDLLQAKALQSTTVYMCAEALWSSCHRSLISDYLKVCNWRVMHIKNNTAEQEHPYTKPARIANGKLVYNVPDLFT